MLNCIICLGFIIFIYYKLNDLMYFSFTQKHHIYFGGFVAFFLLIMYLMNYQTQFVYKMANNIKDPNNIYSHELLPEYSNNVSSNNSIIQNYLLEKQNDKCFYCNRNVDLTYLNLYNISYITLPEHGGENSYENLCLVCPNCYKQL